MILWKLQAGPQNSLSSVCGCFAPARKPQEKLSISTQLTTQLDIAKINNTTQLVVHHTASCAPHS